MRLGLQMTGATNPDLRSTEPPTKKGANVNPKQFAVSPVCWHSDAFPGEPRSSPEP